MDGLPLRRPGLEAYRALIQYDGVSIAHHLAGALPLLVAPGVLLGFVEMVCATTTASVDLLLPTDDFVREPDPSVRADVRGFRKQAFLLHPPERYGRDRHDLQNLLLIEHAARHGRVRCALLQVGLLFDRRVHGVHSTAAVA